jgi:hypothetical protein
MCLFTVEVSLNRRAPYTATCKQRFPESEIARIQPGNTTLAVRANPDDVTRIALDLAAEPPVVTANPTPSGALPFLFPRFPSSGQDRRCAERGGHRLGHGGGAKLTTPAGQPPSSNPESDDAPIMPISDRRPEEGIT